MEGEVICLDSDEEEIQEKVEENVEKHEVKNELKRPADDVVSNESSPEKKIRRIAPTKIGEVDQNKNSSFSSIEESPRDQVDQTEENGLYKIEGSQTSTKTDLSSNSSLRIGNQNEITEELEMLIRACRKAEPSPEMKKIIKKKLLKYYHEVHPSFVTSKMFLKMLRSTAEDIFKEPTYVFSSIKNVIEELDMRRKVVFVEPEPKTDIKTEVKEESKDGPIPSTSKALEKPEELQEFSRTGDKEKDATLKKLHKALVKAKRAIADLEEKEVDWDEDENSAYLKKSRYEKRAAEIYQQICEITGESSHAHRLVKKPIKLKSNNEFSDFYKKLEKTVNRTNEFPNYRDVLKLLDLCNKKYVYKLSPDQQHKIAENAFEKLGKVLQERRRADLYETAVFFTGKSKDPAKDDAELRAQLEKNKKNYARIDEVINGFAEKEEKEGSDDHDEVSSTSKLEVNKDDNGSNSSESENEEPKNDQSVVTIEESPQKKEEEIKKIDCIDDNDDDDLMIIS